MKQFQDLGLSQELLNQLSKQKIQEPTPIQSLTIAHILAGRDLMAEAQTGTGKTLAFLLPIFQRFDGTNPHIQGLILSPTRELAIQITEEAKKLAEGTDIEILAVYGGQDIQKQLKKLKRQVSLVIATPGRLLDHLHRETIDLTHLSTLVLDEADQMLYIGFQNEIEMILKRTNKDKQLLCFSATLDSKVKKIAYKFMKDPLEITAEKESVTLDTIDQEVILSSDRWKQEALFAVLDRTNPFLGIIFCRTRRRADALEAAMTKHGYLCNKLHGSMTQNARQRVMKGFRQARYQYLIATDVAARGLDISGVSHIYNYDIPESPESYIHRIGRTGRMGDSGTAFTFVAPKDQRLLAEIEKLIEMKIPKSEHNHPGSDKKTQGQKRPKGKRSFPSGNRKKKKGRK
jgi:superfamily II DNA/RNA helicase